MDGVQEAGGERAPAKRTTAILASVLVCCLVGAAVSPALIRWWSPRRAVTAALWNVRAPAVVYRLGTARPHPWPIAVDPWGCPWLHNDRSDPTDPLHDVVYSAGPNEENDYLQGDDILPADPWAIDVAVAWCRELWLAAAALVAWSLVVRRLTRPRWTRAALNGFGAVVLGGVVHTTEVRLTPDLVGALVIVPPNVALASSAALGWFLVATLLTTPASAVT